MSVHILVASVEMPFLPFSQETMCVMRILTAISLLVVFFNGKGKFVSLKYSNIQVKLLQVEYPLSGTLGTRRVLDFRV